MAYRPENACDQAAKQGQARSAGREKTPAAAGCSRPRAWQGRRREALPHALRTALQAQRARGRGGECVAGRGQVGIGLGRRRDGAGAVDQAHRAAQVEARHEQQQAGRADLVHERLLHMRLAARAQTG
jgi:hypothetical protein